MANKRYYWLKLKEDFFKSKEMKKLRRVAGGDTYVIIYLKMQLLSLRNEGKLYFEGIDDDFASELALELDEEIENVRMTLNFLEHCNLLECISSEEYFLPVIPDVTGAETRWAEYKRKERLDNVQPKLDNVQSVSNDSPKNVTLEIRERERDRNRDRDRDRDKSIDYQKIADMYNDTCVSFPHLSKISESRKKAIKARFNNGYTYDDFQALFTKAENSSFLKGANSRNWSANFDWLIKDNNMAKVLDGNYDERNVYDGRNQQNGSNSNIQQFDDERKYGSWF